MKIDADIINIQNSDTFLFFIPFGICGSFGSFSRAFHTKKKSAYYLNIVVI